MSHTAAGPPALSRRSFLRYTAVTTGLATLTRLRAAPVAAASGAVSEDLLVFSSNEAEILTAIVERMVHSGDAVMPAVRDTRAIATIDRTLATVDETVVSQLRWLLSIFQYAPPLLDLRMSTFTGMSPEDQDEYLRGWANSRFQTRRLAFRALKNLSMLGYYTQDSTWRGIHYDGPWVPRPAANRVGNVALRSGV
jgi:hypothetical protein